MIYLVKDDLLGDFHNLLNKWRNYGAERLNVRIYLGLVILGKENYM